MSDQRFSPVYREIPFEAPHRVYERLRSPHSFLFDSVKGPEKIARYSFIGIDPYLIYKVKDGAVEIEFNGRKSISSRDPVERLRELVLSYRQDPVDGLPPFQGGAAGMFCYDFVRYLEKLPGNAVDDLNLPDAHFLMIDRLIAFDHKEKKSWVIVCPGARETALGYSDPAWKNLSHFAVAEEALRNICQRISERHDASKPQGRGCRRLTVCYETEKETYMAMVRRAKEYIAAGDIFQANLSLRVYADIGETDPWDIYVVLRDINPSPFCSYVDFGDYHIVSSSPERLVRVKGRQVDTRPIAGTRPRGENSSEDAALRAELLLNEKERAEHIMLIDLERNDLGRVSDFGSVCVDELMTTEDYSHVIHIVSNVRGRLAHDKDCFDVVRATFPGGTITGVPKVRCMEIIDELERTRRGAYTGSIGYIGFNGNMDLNIVIRTFLIRNKKAYIQAGAGIVADSDPEREYQESIRKAEALIKTIERI